MINNVGKGKYLNFLLCGRTLLVKNMLKKKIFWFVAFFMTVGAQAATFKVPLQSFTSARSMEIRCISGGQNISFPIPERWEVRKANLNLRYMVSNNLIGDISQMVVKLNGDPITQFKLNPQSPVTTIDIPLPKEQLEAGYNDLTFQVAQHYLQNNCEQPCAPDLWTNISLSQSYIQIEYDLKPIPLRLGSAVHAIFDPKQFADVTVNLIADTASPETLTLAGVVASGIARHFDYRKVKFSHSLDIREGVDNVLIGSTAFASNVLDRYALKLPKGDGGLMKVFHLPTPSGGVDKMRALVTISADDPIALKIAAQTFTNMSLPYPGTDELRAYSFNIPDISMYGGRQVLATEKVYPFRDLGMSSYTFQGQTGRHGKRRFSGNGTDLTFRLPPDFLIKQNQYAKLNINFAYGAGLRNDSTMTITVNDAPFRDIHLDKVGGGFIEAYKLDIPTYLFKAGSNTITFRPFLNTNRQVCDVAITDGLFVTVFDNSTISFPPMPHFVELPKLDLFALNGFPFTKWPDGYQTMVYLPKPDSSAAIDTALNLIGLMGQRNGFPLFGTQVTFTEPSSWEGELLVVGPSSAIPKFLFERAPMQLEGLGSVPYPVNRSFDSETSFAFSKQVSGLGEGTGLLMQFESPFKKGRSVVVATAQNETDLRTMGDALLNSGILARVAGDLNLIKLNVPEYDINSLSVGSKYATSNTQDVSIFYTVLFFHPFAPYVIMALALMLLGLLIHAFLRHRRTKHAK